MKIFNFEISLNKESIGRFLAQFKEDTKTLRWTALDAYVLNMFIFSFFGSLIMFVFIYELTQIFTELKWLPQGTNGFFLVKYYLCDALFWIITVQPFSFLFAAVYVLSRLAQTRELVAIISTGTSIYRTSFYIVLFTIIYYLFNVIYFQNAVIFPAYQQKFILGKIIFQKADPKLIDQLKDNNSFSIFGSDDLIYIVGSYHAMSKEMDNITIVQMNNKPVQNIETNNSNFQNIWLLTNSQELTKRRNLIYPDNVNITLRIDAEKGIWDNKNKKWIFKNGAIRYVKNSGESFVVQKFDEQAFDFISDPPYYFEQIWYSMDAMTYEEGKKFIEKLKKSGQDYKEELSRYYIKFSYPLGIIFVVLAGIGIVDMSRRKISFIYNLMISLAIFIFYYLCFSVGISLAGKGDIPPLIGAYAGSVIFGTMSIFLYRKVKT